MLSNLVIAVIAAALFITLRRVFSKRGPTMPGPPRTPIVGNIIPTLTPWVTLAKFGEKYGPVYSLQLLMTPAIVVNSVSAARELLESKSGVYAARHPPKMIELSGMSPGVLFETDSNRLRKGRKLMASVLQPKELEQYRSVLRHHTVTFLSNVVRAPEGFLAHLRNIPAGITLEMAYGYSIQGYNDPYVKNANTTFKNFTTASALSVDEAFAVNWMPFLAHLPGFLPGTSFKALAETYRKQFIGLMEEGHQMVKTAIANGMAKESLTSKALRENPDYDEEEIIKYTATQLYAGGSETSISSLSSFIRTMTTRPDVQKKAQEELDRVVGHDRLPTLADRPNLPYVDAVLRETIRCFPVLPTFYRNPVEDDVYNGYHIPKGTTLLVNVWGMLHDPNVYENPHTFDPDRWLKPGVDKTDKNIDPLEIAFGFGRRLCPGKHLAVEIMFTVIASLLAVFDITKARRECGEEITIVEEYSKGSIVGPLPFECNINPRSEKSKQLVEHAFNAL
ncbi:hypothetical protein NLI96_g1725 [Meripilus lineatus]|uniref:Cytochrome P450 n=1 Tax=Meripilus lineatus TaxID=2056292 RepID=A0AAD5YH85_9APHY|nr:hypothetical protein NLI96_g1725 [Physisporinus lineatus]